MKQINTPKRNQTMSKEKKRKEKKRKPRRVEEKEKIPRAYTRLTVVPTHRVAIVYPPLEVMRQAVQQTTKETNKTKQLTT